MGIVDSTGVLDVITFIENEFDIKIPPEDMLPENLDSIERIAAYVTGNLSGGHSPRAAARSVERG
jgi:acyl carrier protein